MTALFRMPPVVASIAKAHEVRQMQCEFRMIFQMFDMMDCFRLLRFPIFLAVLAEITVTPKRG